jgi:hypothetical protein
MKTNTMLELLQSNHTILDGVKMLLVTWNVNAKLDEMKNLRKLFFDPDQECLTETPEIIVVGLQEMVELSTSNVIGGSTGGASVERADMWRTMVLQVLKERDMSFEMVVSKNMVGLCMTIFALRPFRQHISQVQVSSLGRGVGGVLGNKGAVYARFNIKDTSICLVCAHFAAHREQLLRRNEDFYAILTFKAFSNPLDGVCNVELPNLSQHAAAAKNTEAAKMVRLRERIDAMKRTLLQRNVEVSPPSNLKRDPPVNLFGALDHDIIIWIGDLNYRLLGGLENHRIYDTIDGNRAHRLLSMDQLNIERENGNVFQGFHEGLITFDPTYKYHPGSTLGYIRERCPAWCDRVLWKLKHAYIEPGYDVLEQETTFDPSEPLKDLTPEPPTEAEVKVGAVEGAAVGAVAGAAVGLAVGALPGAAIGAAVCAVVGASQVAAEMSEVVATAHSAEDTTARPAVPLVVPRPGGRQLPRVESASANDPVWVPPSERGDHHGLPRAESVSANDPVWVPPASRGPTAAEVAFSPVDDGLVVDPNLLAASQSYDEMDRIIHSMSSAMRTSESSVESTRSVPAPVMRSSEVSVESTRSVPAPARDPRRRRSFIISSNKVGVLPTSFVPDIPLNETKTLGIAALLEDVSTEEPDTPVASAIQATAEQLIAETAPSTGPPLAVSPTTPHSRHSTPDARATEIVELMMYNRAENIISDHKPVRAMMGIKYRRYDIYCCCSRVLLVVLHLVCMVRLRLRCAAY